ncbi:hypothetical protein SNEBB_011236 [Seison nebaliae]|nr:hypothetical protein SNEBB_011236 [Seison nebaliae]
MFTSLQQNRYHSSDDIAKKSLFDGNSYPRTKADELQEKLKKLEVRYVNGRKLHKIDTSKFEKSKNRQSQKNIKKSIKNPIRLPPVNKTNVTSIALPKDRTPHNLLEDERRMQMDIISGVPREFDINNKINENFTKNKLVNVPKISNYEYEALQNQSKNILMRLDAAREERRVDFYQDKLNDVLKRVDDALHYYESASIAAQYIKPESWTEEDTKKVDKSKEEEKDDDETTDKKPKLRNYIKHVPTLEQLQEIIGNKIEKQKYQQQISIFIVGYSTASKEREELLDEINDFFNNSAKNFLADHKYEDLNFDLEEVDQDVHLCIDNAFRLANRLGEINDTILNHVANSNIGASKQMNKAQRKRLEQKQLGLAKEEILSMNDKIKNLMKDIESKDDQLQKLFNQVEIKNAEIEKLKIDIASKKNSARASRLRGSSKDKSPSPNSRNFTRSNSIHPNNISSTLKEQIRPLLSNEEDLEKFDNVLKNVETQMVIINNVNLTRSNTMVDIEKKPKKKKKKKSKSRKRKSSIKFETAAAKSDTEEILLKNENKDDDDLLAKLQKVQKLGGTSTLDDGNDGQPIDWDKILTAQSHISIDQLPEINDETFWMHKVTKSNVVLKYANIRLIAIGLQNKLTYQTEQLQEKNQQKMIRIKEQFLEHRSKWDVDKNKTVNSNNPKWETERETLMELTVTAENVQKETEEEAVDAFNRIENLIKVQEEMDEEDLKQLELARQRSNSLATYKAKVGHSINVDQLVNGELYGANEEINELNDNDKKLQDAASEIVFHEEIRQKVLEERRSLLVTMKNELAMKKQRILSLRNLKQKNSSKLIDKRPVTGIPMNRRMQISIHPYEEVTSSMLSSRQGNRTAAIPPVETITEIKNQDELWKEAANTFANIYRSFARKIISHLLEITTEEQFVQLERFQEDDIYFQTNTNVEEVDELINNDMDKSEELLRIISQLIENHGPKKHEPNMHMVNEIERLNDRNQSQMNVIEILTRQLKLQTNKSFYSTLRFQLPVVRDLYEYKRSPFTLTKSNSELAICDAIRNDASDDFYSLFVNNHMMPLQRSPTFANLYVHNLHTNTSDNLQYKSDELEGQIESLSSFNTAGSSPFNYLNNSLKLDKLFQSSPHRPLQNMEIFTFASFTYFTRSDVRRNNLQLQRIVDFLEKNEINKSTKNHLNKLTLQLQSIWETSEEYLKLIKKQFILLVKKNVLKLRSLPIIPEKEDEKDELNGKEEKKLKIILLKLMNQKSYQMQMVREERRLIAQQITNELGELEQRYHCVLIRPCINY